MLSELLSAKEPDFRLMLQQLERANGEPCEDIRLSSEINQKVQSKIRSLGLDPTDTSGPELYNVLNTRLLGDEHRFREALGLSDYESPAAVFVAVEKFINRVDLPRSCFGLKAPVAKRLLKASSPLKAMKQIGYRSVDSMLKHEPVENIFAAIQIFESPSWQQNFLDKYKGLHANDFEPRKLKINLLSAKRWQKSAEVLAGVRHHSIVEVKELGAVLVLPVAADVPALAITSVLLIFQAVNNIRCASTYLKLQQVKPDFGAEVKEVVNDEPSISAQIAGQTLSWRFLQHYYDSLKHAFHPAIFEPHVQPEDIDLAHAEEILANNIPALEFWLDTANLALVDGGYPVSLNMLDVALNTVNDLPFEQRVYRCAQEKIWHNLFSRYLNENNLNLVNLQLSGELVEAQPQLDERMDGI
jgi:hypothetical protein